MVPCREVFPFARLWRRLVLPACEGLGQRGRRGGKVFLSPMEKMCPMVVLAKSTVSLSCLVGHGKVCLACLCSHLSKKNLDGTKMRNGAAQPLLRVEDHDFTMRPAFGGRTVPFPWPGGARPPGCCPCSIPSLGPCLPPYTPSPLVSSLSQISLTWLPESLSFPGRKALGEREWRGLLTAEELM